MKKVFAIIGILVALALKNEIVSMALLAMAVISFAVFVLIEWAKHEPKKLPGSFETDWGAK